jgi:membrane-bound lytic murein transglycosylase B
MVAEASQRFGIPASWIRAVMQVESFGDVRALSPKGAMGLMQIMPESWATLRSRYGLGGDPYDAHDNILAGAAYLRELLDRYGSPGFLAAYNAGPARYEDHLATGRALPAETQAYVTSLAPMIGGGTIDDATVVNAVVRSWTEAPLFVVSAESTAAKSPASSNLRSGQRSTDSPAQDWTGLAPQSPGMFIGISHGNRQP